MFRNPAEEVLLALFGIGYKHITNAAHRFYKPGGFGIVIQFFAQPTDLDVDSAVETVIIVLTGHIKKLLSR